MSSKGLDEPAQSHQCLYCLHTQRCRLRPKLRPLTTLDSYSYMLKELLYAYAISTVKPVQNGHSQKDRKLVFKTNYRLMQVKSISECSKGSILQYFWPSLSYHLSLRFLFCLFLSGCFTQVLLYHILMSRFKLFSLPELMICLQILLSMAFHANVSMVTGKYLQTACYIELGCICTPVVPNS